MESIAAVPDAPATEALDALAPSIPDVVPGDGVLYRATTEEHNAIITHNGGNGYVGLQVHLPGHAHPICIHARYDRAGAPGNWRTVADAHQDMPADGGVCKPADSHLMDSFAFACAGDAKPSRAHQVGRLFRSIADVLEY